MKKYRVYIDKALFAVVDVEASSRKDAHRKGLQSPNIEWSEPEIDVCRIAELDENGDEIQKVETQK